MSRTLAASAGVGTGGETEARVGCGLRRPRYRGCGHVRGLRCSIDERGTISGEESAMNGTTDNGITRIASKHSVAMTLERFESLLKERGVMIFTRIDFSGDAARARLTMRPEQMLL